ncbi:MAG: hypothetical protein R3F09_12830 [Burkholderiaceae bacterium]
MATALVSAPMAGDKLYQVRARNALPLLVRQAEAKNTITYSDLASELEMPNPRNLNYVLGSVGRTIEGLSRKWKAKVPPIQCVVVNGTTGLPGEGIGWFLVKKNNYASLPPDKKRAVVKAELAGVFGYPYWSEVLEEVGLQRQTGIAVQALPNFGGGGEGPEHKRLKTYVAANPAIIGLSEKAPHGRMEECLLSGDALDVSFQDRRLWVAAEVKSHISSELDIQRGLFQCVKYRAVMEAQAQAAGAEFDVRSVLVLGCALPTKLKPLKNMLGIEVIESIHPQ